MFFACRERPLQLSPEDLRSLQLSLNTPVVRVESLPVAPARAVLVLHATPAGDLDVTLSVRSLKSGQVLHFAPGERLADAASCLEAAMSFGEAMGFLFDDDELAVGNAERALGIWAELMGDPPTLPPVAVEPAPALAEDLPTFDFVADEDENGDQGDLELLLVEAIEEAVDDEPAAPAEAPHEVSPPPDTMALTSMVEDALAADQVPAEAEPGSGQPAEPTLTKFRPAPAVTPAEAGAEEIASHEPGEAESELDAEPAETALLETDEELEVPFPEDEVLAAEASASAEPTPASEAPETDEASSEPVPSEDDTPVLHAADTDQLEAPVPRRRRLRKAALGRLRLVKKRKPASDDERRQWLARILSAF